jgi:hypothetical protein
MRFFFFAASLLTVPFLCVFLNGIGSDLISCFGLTEGEGSCLALVLVVVLLVGLCLFSCTLTQCVLGGSKRLGLAEAFAGIIFVFTTPVGVEFWCRFFLSPELSPALQFSITPVCVCLYMLTRWLFCWGFWDLRVIASIRD